MGKVFIVDSAKCSGCYNCQIACKDEHVGNEWLPYAKSQPNSGQFWLKVVETEHGNGDKVRVEYTPTLCNHCEECPLITLAPDAVYRREDGLVIIDPIKAEGRRELVEACPYGAVYWNEKLALPQKCTGCAHLVDEGKLPHCVDLCATAGLRFGDEEEFAEEIAAAETMGDIAGGVRVYYINRPHLFLAGDVWDPEADEIIEGAHIVLTFADGHTEETVSDDFGDFYFRHIDAGEYSLRIEADGFASAERKGIRLDKSLNLGDFPLKKA